MKNGSLLKGFMWILVLVMIPVLIYLIIDIGSAKDVFERYNSLSPATSSSIEKSTSFIKSYIRSTGDLSLAEVIGMSEEEMQTLAQDGTSLGDTGSPSQPASTGDVMIDSAISVASKFTKFGDYDYSQHAGSEGTIDYGGKYVTTWHRDCSCFCSAMRYLNGIDSSFVHRTSSVFGVMTTKNVSTYADVVPGDVLWKSGHVAMVVKKEGDTVYIADCGSTNAITKTATMGYAYTVSSSTPFPGVAGSHMFQKVIR